MWVPRHQQRWNERWKTCLDGEQHPFWYNMVSTYVLQVEKNSDEGVKLKMLQTALTLLQNPASADSEVCEPHRTLWKAQSFKDHLSEICTVQVII